MTTGPEPHGAVMVLSFSFSMVHLADPFLTESLQTARVFQQVPWWLEGAPPPAAQGMAALATSPSSAISLLPLLRS